MKLAHHILIGTWVIAFGRIYTLAMSSDDSLVPHIAGRDTLQTSSATDDGAGCLVGANGRECGVQTTTSTTTVLPLPTTTSSATTSDAFSLASSTASSGLSSSSTIPRSSTVSASASISAGTGSAASIAHSGTATGQFPISNSSSTFQATNTTSLITDTRSTNLSTTISNALSTSIATGETNSLTSKGPGSTSSAMPSSTGSNATSSSSGIDTPLSLSDTTLHVSGTAVTSSSSSNLRLPQTSTILAGGLATTSTAVIGQSLSGSVSSQLSTAIPISATSLSSSVFNASLSSTAIEGGVGGGSGGSISSPMPGQHTISGNSSVSLPFGTNNSRTSTALFDSKSPATTTESKSTGSTSSRGTSSTSIGTGSGTMTGISNTLLGSSSTTAAPSGTSRFSLSIPTASDSGQAKFSGTTTAPPSSTTTSDFMLGWVPTVSSDSVTVGTDTFSFNIATDSQPVETGSAAESFSIALAAWTALHLQMSDTRNLFDDLIKSYKGFQDAVDADSSGDDSTAGDAVQKAGSSLFGLFKSVFHAAAGVGSACESIALSRLDTNGNELINTVRRLESNTIDFGKIVNNLQDLALSKMKMKYAKWVLTTPVAKVFGGVTIAVLLDRMIVLPVYGDAPPPTKTKTESVSSSTSAVPDVTGTYCIVTKRGTSMLAYEAFLKTLPDKGLLGNRIDYASMDSQVYTTQLSSKQAEDVKKLPIVRSMILEKYIPDDSFDSGDYRGDFRQIHKRATVNPNMNLVVQGFSNEHLDVISQSSENAVIRQTAPWVSMPPYSLGASAGLGTTIFVVDTGINPNHPEFARSYDVNDYFIVPNGLLGLPLDMPHPTDEGMIPYVPDSDQFMSDSHKDSHGTMVASLATGLTKGAAKKAHLVPVKWRNTRGQVTATAVESALRYILNRVISTNRGQYYINNVLVPAPPRSGWAILNLSAGFSNKAGVYEGTPEWNARQVQIQELLNEFWQNDIVTVLAAGNYGEYTDFDLSMSIPQNLGTSTNPLITVGACDTYGDRWKHTTLESSSSTFSFLTGLSGSMTTWLVGDRVEAASKLGGYVIDSGTSFAAPQVSGLIAYYLSMPQAELVPTPGNLLGPDLHRRGRVAQAAKDYLVSMQYVRSSVPRDSDATSPGSYGVPVASNGAAQGYCEAVVNSWLKKRTFRQKSRAVPADEYGLTPLVTAGILVSDVDYDNSATCPAKT